MGPASAETARPRTAIRLAAATARVCAAGGPRRPLLGVSPWAKHDYVDNTLTDQSSILRFVEDNWSLGRIGDGSYDAKAGTLLNMFSFRAHDQGGQRRLLLDEST